ncbi:MAG: hypothetical protein WC059_00365 [Candidatus Paceibacterota bacterium]
MEQQEEIKKAIQERFENLQPEIQDAIMSSNYEKELYDISQKYKLNIEQMGQLELNTTLVMLGNTHPDEYVDELVTDLKIKKEDALAISNDVNERIMKNIREILKKNFEKEDEEESASKEVPVPPQNPILPTEATVKTETALKTNLTTPLPKTQSGILANAGIEMMEDMKTNTKDGEDISKKEGGVLSESGINVIDDAPRPSSHVFASNMTRKNTLDGIENPTRTNPNIAMEKLQNPTTSTQSTTNYSIPRMSGDQYREPIE